MPGRPFVWLLLGVTALAGIGVGSWYYLESFRAKSTAPAAAAPAAEQTVVCFGFVDLPGGVIPVYSRQQGRVKEVSVKEDDEVEWNAPLLRLDQEVENYQLKAAQEELRAAELAVEQAEHLAKLHTDKIAQQEAVLELAKARQKTAEEVLKRRKNSTAGSVAEDLVTAAQNSADKATAAVKLEDLRLAEIKKQNLQLEVDRAGAVVKAKKIRVQEAEDAVAECTIRPPVQKGQKGKVLRILTKPGELVGPTAGHPLLWFAPSHEPRIIRAEIDQEFAARVKVGDRATIHDATNGPGEWRGRVIRKSDWYTNRRALLQETAQLIDLRTLECVIAIEPADLEKSTMPIGQRVRVSLKSGP